MTDKPRDVDLNDPDSLRQWAARQPLVPLPDAEVEVGFDFINAHLRLRRNARRAWIVWAVLLAVWSTLAVAHIWTSDERFTSTGWVVIGLLVIAGTVAASFSGRAERIEKRFEK